MNAKSVVKHFLYQECLRGICCLIRKKDLTSVKFAKKDSFFDIIYWSIF
ncbi:unnamed protein product [Larinioides sclopetarius]|uniref:Uncharacterized protein n=1 Tax=Larinioides sclopetarius TaxID=280406 RepID=A0AAV2BEX2_9ARAC